MAAKKLGLTSFKAIVLEPNKFDVKLGLEKTAERWNLKTLDDVKIIEGSKHPLMEAATMLLPDEDAVSINRRLVDNSDSGSDLKF
jgi:IMP dehydrogenase